MTNVTVIVTLIIEFRSKLSSFADVIVLDTFVGLHVITEI